MIEESVGQLHGKVDKITDLLIEQARTDEKLAALKAIVDRHDSDLRECVEFKNKNTRIVAWVDKGLLALIVLGLVTMGFLKQGG